MADIGALIDKIIQAMKDFINSVEKEGERVIGVLATYSSKVATDISTVMKEVFEDIKRKISMIIRAFKSKIEAFTRRIKKPNTGSGETLGTRIKNASRDAYRKTDELAKKFEKVMDTTLTEMRIAMKKIVDGIKSGATDVISSARRIGEKVVQEMEKIGKGAIDESKNATQAFSKDIQLEGNFVHKHGVQVATAAAVSIINPYLIGSAILSAGMIIGATKYNPS